MDTSTPSILLVPIPHELKYGLDRSQYKQVRAFNKRDVGATTLLPPNQSNVLRVRVTVTMREHFVADLKNVVVSVFLCAPSGC